MAARVLVVDDEPAVSELVSRILSRAGFEVASASDPRQALEIVSKGPAPDLIVSDVVMPGMRGPELVREINRVSPATAGVLMSAFPAESLPSGVPFLKKPFSPNELVSVVQAALARSQKLRDDVKRSSRRSAELQAQAAQRLGELDAARLEADQAVRKSRENRKRRRE